MLDDASDKSIEHTVDDLWRGVRSILETPVKVKLAGEFSHKTP